jgi:glycosyltransferase involved in cell wall biosynthesis
LKTLYITSKPAYPKVDGGCVASANFLENLLNVTSEIKYLSIATTKHPFNLDSFPIHWIDSLKPEAVLIETAVRPKEAIKYLFNKKSYNIDRFYNREMSDKIVSIIDSQRFDTIILDGLYTTPYLSEIKKAFKGKVLVRTHNVEFKIWEGRAKNESNPIKKKYLRGLAKDLKKYEIETLNKVDGLMTISQEDLNDFNALGISAPKSNITVTADIVEQDHDYKRASIFHLGAMNWSPNIEAVDQVIQLMPELRKSITDLEFHIAGVDSESLYTTNKDQGIVVEGFVQDLKEFVSEMGILVSPIQSGSGIRVKILEMMALGIPVITTDLGAQGLLNFDGVRIANTKQEILSAVYELVNNENKRQELGLEAKRYVNLHHNPEKVSAQLIEFIKST